MNPIHYILRNLNQDSQTIIVFFFRNIKRRKTQINLENEIKKTTVVKESIHVVVCKLTEINLSAKTI